MLSVIRARLSYANVMASVAVFLALGGTSLAVAKEPDQTGSDQSAESAAEDADAEGNETPDGVEIAIREGSDVGTDDERLEVTVSARCQEDEVLTGGGVRTVDAGGAEPVVRSSHPSEGNARTWTATVGNANGNGNVTAVPYALCAR